MLSATDSAYDGLRLTIFQLRPISSSGSIVDGSNAVLMNILSHFAKLGVRTTIHHPATTDRSETFDLLTGVKVAPVSPMLMANNSGSLWADPMRHTAAIESLWESIDDSDRFYVHGANLPYFDFTAECPTIHSVHDFVYHEAVTGVLNFRRDRLIAVSDYTASCMREVFKRIRPIPEDALHVIPNGFSPSRFSPNTSGDVRARIGVSKDDLCLLYPHRSDPDKGIMGAIETVHFLQRLLPANQYARLRLLIPAWEAPRLGRRAPQNLTLPPDARRYAIELGVADKLHIHEWVSTDEMPQYYSIGVATLCLGSVPEAFGNVHIESLLTGTPAVVARVGAQRTSIPEGLVRKVDPGQVEHAAQHVAKIIMASERVSDELRSFLIDRYSLKSMSRGYEKGILDCELQSPVKFSRPPSLNLDADVRIPPWAAVLESGYFHDYAGYCSDREFLEFLPEIRRGVSVRNLVRYCGVRFDEVRRWLHSGLVSIG